MKRTVLIVILLIPVSLFAQQNDSIPPKQFTAFFGCDCCQEKDTVCLQMTYKHKCVYECMLYRSQFVLKARKNGRVVWKADLRSFNGGKEANTWCVFDGGRDQKGRERIVLSAGSSAVEVRYLKNGKPVKQRTTN